MFNKFHCVIISLISSPNSSCLLSRKLKFYFWGVVNINWHIFNIFFFLIIHTVNPYLITTSVRTPRCGHECHHVQQSNGSLTWLAMSLVVYAWQFIWFFILAIWKLFLCNLLFKPYICMTCKPCKNSVVYFKLNIFTCIMYGKTRLN